jgi:hypothetical protein
MMRMMMGRKMMGIGKKMMMRMGSNPKKVQRPVMIAISVALRRNSCRRG